MSRQRLAPQTGVAFALRTGETLTVTDLEGEQVADLFCFADDDRTDALSSGRSIDYNETIRFGVGHILYASSGRKFLQLGEDTCGLHDFLVTPCSLQMFQMSSGTDAYHPSCHENLARALAPWGIAPHQITTTFNIFMNVPVDARGKIAVLPPTSRRGDYVRFIALTNLVVGLTACSDEGTNAGRCKPIGWEITR